ncbi:MAG: hypothetical protein Q7U66_03715 [Methylobacter sp.]|nr:hypothetical protein [Methylobacter sp.]
MLDKQLEFILVCKPDSHKTLHEWVDDLERNGVVKTVVQKRWTGKRHEIDTYRLCERPCHWAIQMTHCWVNRCEITTRAEDGKVLYRNAFATSLAIGGANVAEIVASGRAR